MTASRASIGLLLFSGVFLGVWTSLAVLPQTANGQTATAAATSPPQSAEPIYWRQNLFLIPYQWSTANDPTAARAVWLYVSKDRGATWQQISEARPEVRAFTYHAEGDGEYWFAIRTIDASGRALPATPMLPELRVIVDTAIPRIDELSAVPRADGAIDITCRASDVNLDVHAWAIESQVEASGSWQAVPVLSAVPVGGATSTGSVTCQLPAGSRVTSVRATVCDRAGNRALSQTSVQSSASGNVAANQGPQFITARGDATAPQIINNPAAQAAVVQTQPWPADRAAMGWSAAPATATAAAGPETKFGVPKSIGWTVPAELANGMGTAANGNGGAIPEPKADDRPLGNVPLATSPPFAPLEPFREPKATAATTQATSGGGNRVPAREASFGSGDTKLQGDNRVAGDPERREPSPNPSLQGRGISAPKDAIVKQVNSRSFALEYEVDDVSQRGVSKVELWGTRDSGQTWRSFAVDNDNRSPLTVTVDGEGLYGFRIVVEGADGAGGFAPHAGDAPDLWVGVDMHRPQVELTSVDPGHGRDAGELMVCWRAQDDNLDSRPIALFYSSRATGPWTAIATSLENSGEYGWRVERHVPTRIYLRLEARDTAGNLAAYQTTEPVAIEVAAPAGRAESVHSIDANDGPTAARAKDWSR